MSSTTNYVQRLKEQFEKGLVGSPEEETENKKYPPLTVKDFGIFESSVEKKLKNRARVVRSLSAKTHTDIVFPASWKPIPAKRSFTRSSKPPTPICRTNSNPDGNESVVQEVIKAIERCSISSEGTTNSDQKQSLAYDEDVQNAKFAADGRRTVEDTAGEVQVHADDFGYASDNTKQEDSPFGETSPAPGDIVETCNNVLLFNVDGAEDEFSEDMNPYGSTICETFNYKSTNVQTKLYLNAEIENSIRKSMASLEDIYHLFHSEENDHQNVVVSTAQEVDVYPEIVADKECHVPIDSSSNKQLIRCEEGEAQSYQVDSAADNNTDQQCTYESSKYFVLEKTTPKPNRVLMRTQSAQNASEYLRYSSVSSSSDNSTEGVWTTRLSGGAIKTETYYDEQRHPRIETVTELPPISTNAVDGPCKSDDEGLTKRKPKLCYIIEELIETEKSYVQNLRNVITEYMIHLEISTAVPEHLKNLTSYIFGNIRSIYKQTCEFFEDLCACDRSWDSIAKKFIVHKPLFQLYPIYSKNKPKANAILETYFKEIVLQRQLELKQSLDLSCFLLSPIQRITKYRQILENLKSELGKMGIMETPSLDTALTIIQQELRRGNDYIAIDSITGWREDMTTASLGSFIRRDVFAIKAPKRFEAMAFLFERMVVLTTAQSSEQFTFQSCIPMDLMGLVDFGNDPLVFHLRYFLPKKVMTIVFEAKSPKVKEEWTKHIFNVLFEQMEKAREHNQQHQNKREPSKRTKSCTDRRKSGLMAGQKIRGNSIFYGDIVDSGGNTKKKK